ncbi:OLC1v1010147C1 [Oldenlandia corymbosa var. corymbosa]|uniref:OLC1v1010147C1 n=1 Tax=Oldenlandia corymbosa var. corymbosa TaxID=529605 RepID=A0AAV1DQM5_OLDCO|nr:OLC1v1010147C1 [Oldenlandia corymbosa var. corymbosa]
MTQRTVPAPFLTKTYQLVDDPGSDDIISWNESGTTFVVWKTAEFAKDLLPNYFKHNNFSSFVRQLNTYGFRKIVPDKWEFANENFKRGHKELLTEIRRRKTIATAANGMSNAAANPSSTENSGDDQGSSSTSSPDSKNPGSVDTPSAEQFADLSGENEKLKKDNQMLSSELAQTKKQCDDLIAFLTKYLKVEPDQINSIMTQQGINSGSSQGAMVSTDVGLNSLMDKDNNTSYDDDDDENENGKSLKLFGVTLSKGKNKKRGREDETFGDDGQKKGIKTVDFCAAPVWLKPASYSGESSKVCN